MDIINVEVKGKNLSSKNYCKSVLCCWRMVLYNNNATASLFLDYLYEVASVGALVYVAEKVIIYATALSMLIYLHNNTERNIISDLLFGFILKVYLLK